VISKTKKREEEIESEREKKAKGKERYVLRKAEKRGSDPEIEKNGGGFGGGFIVTQVLGKKSWSVGTSLIY